MSELKENWQQENLEKTKKVLKEHFKRKKEEEMFKEMFKELISTSTPTQLHYGDNWEVETSEFDDFNNDFKKNITKINDDFIWKDLTDSNDKKEKEMEK